MKDKAIEKFWASIEKTKFCWNWTGYLDKSGLPVIRMGSTTPEGKTKLTEFSPRRLSLELDGRVISPSDRAQPLICRNKLCVNPNHLVIGDEARFWAKVQRLGDNDCWIWIGQQDKDMYGKFQLHENGKQIHLRAHQYSWQLYTGRPIPKGLKVCHHCDHPYCVNPLHLFIGTTLDNNRDAVEKGRNPHGETNGQSKLTDEQVKEIRELYKTGTVSYAQLSHLFGVSVSVIGSIIRRERWIHVP
jgi:hypothetical protein